MGRRRVNRASGFAIPIICTRNDLDLFGPASLFELLSIARTRAGEETLAAWLLAPADPDEIVARQRRPRT